MNSTDIYNFWFKELTPKDWWSGSKEIDSQIKNRFQDLHTRAVAGELSRWRESAQGRLCEIIVIDQFSRNIYRGDKRSFIYDPMALVLAQELVRLGLDQKLSTTERSFAYLPYMHSESALIHAEAVKLYQAEGLEYNYDFELRHKAIIDRFGRYPHRNEILERQSTQEEIEFLKTPGSSF